LDLDQNNIIYQGRNYEWQDEIFFAVFCKSNRVDQQGSGNYIQNHWKSIIERRHFRRNMKEFYFEIWV